MFQAPYLREIEALYREASDAAHDVVFGDGLSGELWERFHAVTQLGLMLLDGQKLDERKLKEVNHLLLFAMNLPGFPDGQIYAGENPDFRIILPNRKIGIEVRDVYIEGPGKNSMRLQESLHDEMIEQAHELYKRKGGPPLCVTFDFANNTDYRKTDIPRVSQQLVDCLPAGLGSSTDYKRIGPHNANGPWLPELVSLSARAPYGGQVNARWRSGHGGSVYSSKEFLQKGLDDKEDKLENYRNSGCNEFWLLLIVPHLAPSSFMHPPKPDHLFTSSFDRVFFFQLHGPEIVEMNCKKPLQQHPPS